MITTNRTWHFNASHALAHHGNGGRPHLHAYAVTVEVGRDDGAEVEADTLDAAWRAIAPLVEDADLDAELVAPRHIPVSSCGHVARFLLREFQGEIDDDIAGVNVYAVTLADTPSTSVRMRA